MVEENKGENLGEENKSIYAGLSTGQIKKLKAKLKAEKDAAAKAGGAPAEETAKDAEAAEVKAAPSKPAAAAKGKKGAKAGPGAAVAEKLRL